MLKRCNQYFLVVVLNTFRLYILHLNVWGILLSISSCTHNLWVVGYICPFFFYTKRSILTRKRSSCPLELSTGPVADVTCFECCHPKSYPKVSLLVVRHAICDGMGDGDGLGATRSLAQIII